MSMNRDTEHCQPCDNYQNDDQQPFNIHECWAPIPGTDKRCAHYGGAVRFCINCKKDHHVGGYNTCRGTWHSGGKFICQRNHPLCLARIKEPEDTAHVRHAT